MNASAPLVGPLVGGFTHAPGCGYQEPRILAPRVTLCSDVISRCNHLCGGPPLQIELHQQFREALTNSLDYMWFRNALRYCLERQRGSPVEDNSDRAWGEALSDGSFDYFADYNLDSSSQSAYARTWQREVRVVLFTPGWASMLPALWICCPRHNHRM